MNLIKAFILRDLAIEKTYRFHFFIKTAGIFFQLAIFYFLSRLISYDNYFPFVLFGLMFSRFFQFWLNVFALNIRQEQHWGTSELVYLSPEHPLKVLFSSISGKLIILFFELISFLLIGKLIFKADFFFNFPAMLPILVLNSAAFAGIGLISGSFIMYFKRGDPVNWFVSSSFDLLSGVYFPLKLLPSFLLPICGLLPTTSALSIWRGILLDNVNPSLRQYAVQLIWAAVLLSIGIICFNKAFKATKIKGELGSY